MTFNLQPHSGTTSAVVQGVDVHHEWKSSDTLWLRYFVDCPVDDLYLPDPADAQRMDNLWHTTCFELFLREPDQAPYCEFNFSPSTEWAAYGFTDYRQGVHDMDVPAAPAIAPLDAGDSYLALEVDVKLPPDRLYPSLLAAISAIIVDAQGNKTFWSYRHPAGTPDFHHADCFAARLSPPETS